MLELIILIILCRGIRRIAESKELSSFKYTAYTILLWFGFEAVFWLLGMVFFRAPILAYLFALIGAALGGYIAYRIVEKATPSFTDFEEIP